MLLPPIACNAPVHRPQLAIVGRKEDGATPNRDLWACLDCLIARAESQELVGSIARLLTQVEEHPRRPVILVFILVCIDFNGRYRNTLVTNVAIKAEDKRGRCAVRQKVKIFTRKFVIETTLATATIRLLHFPKGGKAHISEPLRCLTEASNRR